ncbi:hypothetical protein AB0N93_21060 [Streptomyces sp. NPDC091267]|uniref:hypothetical protein n=1 Tax=Streptomyces sp. NPDC091267 TaxID=3155195 RepID=UPI00342945A2
MGTQKSIRNARWTLTGGRWFLITGLVFYSAMTTTPFVSRHSEWAWSGWVLGLIVDVAFIMALSAESTLARHGVTSLGRWPVAFRWTTGLASTFLNVWLSIERRDWVGVVVHVIAPALVMLLAEVGPVYMAALADAERRANKTDTFAEQFRTAMAGPNAVMVLPSRTEPVAAPEAREEPELDPAEPEPQDEPETDAQPVDEPVADELHDDEPVQLPLPKARLTNAEADAIIEKAWRHKVTPTEAAAAATRHPATVRRKFAEFDAALSV